MTVRCASFSYTRFSIFPRFCLLRNIKAHCNWVELPLHLSEAHGSSAQHCFRCKTLPRGRHFGCPRGFLSSRIVYYSNGTSTFNLTKVKLSGDVESNLSPETDGVRGVSGSLNVANSSQHGASLPPSVRLNTNLLSVPYTNARSTVNAVSDICRLQTNSPDKQYLSLNTHFK